MSLLLSLIAALDRLSGQLLVLRSGERPYIQAGDTRHELGSSTLSFKAIETLAQQILSPRGRQEFAEKEKVTEPLSPERSATPRIVRVERAGDQVFIELCNAAQPEPVAAPPAVAAPATPPAPATPTAHGNVAAAAASTTTSPGTSPIASLIAALLRTGGEQLVLRSGDRPHALKGQTRRDLGNAKLQVKALEGLASQILSAGAQRELAEHRAAVEPLSAGLAAIPLIVRVERTGTELCIQFLRSDPQPQTVAAPAIAAAAPVAIAPAPEPVGLPASALRAGADRESGPPSQHWLVGSHSDPTVAKAGEATAGKNPDTTYEGAEAAAPPDAAVPFSAPEALAVAEAPRGASDRWADLIAAAPTMPASRPHASTDAPGPKGPGLHADTSLEEWIAEAARRGATALYLRGGQASAVRVNDRLEPLASSALDASLVAKATAAFAAGDHRWHQDPDGMWVREFEDIGEVRCFAFTDHLGAALVVHLSPQTSAVALQKHIPRQVRRACEGGDGIILVSAEVEADVLAMIAAVADLSARSRAGYVVSVEPPHGLGHEITGAFVSARKIAGREEDVAAAIRRAAHERPDILVIAPPASAATAEEAILAVKPGCLVILGVVAATTSRAVESLLTLMSPERELQLRRSLAGWFRAGFSYVALYRKGGGRTVVHDVMMGTTDVRSRLERADFAALDKLQRNGADGMRSLDVALADAVVRGDISLRQAAAHAIDRSDVVSLIRRYARERRKILREQRLGDRRPGVLRAIPNP